MKNRKITVLVIVIILLVAGFLDLKFEGLFFRMLPESFQSYIARLLN